MEFHQKLNQIFTIAKCSNLSIAREVGISPSALSRFRNGTRTPKEARKTISKLSSAITAFAAQNGSLDELAEFLAVPPQSDRVHERLELFLMSDSIFSKRTTLIDRKEAQKFFGSKLREVCDSLELSNARLSRYLNIDPSLLSRYRSGARMPRPDSDFFYQLSSAIKQIAARRKNGIDISGLNLSADQCAACSEEDFALIMRRWFYESNRSANAYTGALAFLQNMRFEDRTAEESAPQDKEKHSENSLEHKAYVGLDGYVCAVMDLLEAAAKSHIVPNLYIYLDYSAYYLLCEIADTARFIDLLYQITQNGTKVKFVTDAERDIFTGFGGITNWIKVYETGNMKSYSVERYGSKNLFTHTYIVAEGLGALASSPVSGTEDKAQTNVITDETYVRYLTEQLKSIVSRASVAVQVFTTDCIEECFKKFKSLSSHPGRVQALYSYLSIATLSPEHLEDLIKRARLDLGTAEYIRDIYRLRFETVENLQGSSESVELFTLPDSSPDAVLNDIVFFDERIKEIYTREDLKRNLDYIQEMNKNLPHKIRYTIESNAFRNGIIIVKQGVGVLVFTASKISSALWIENKGASNTASEYFSALELRAQRGRAHNA